MATQLARRNDEVRALRERVRLLEHVLHKGDKDYTSRLNDIKTLANEVNALRWQQSQFCYFFILSILLEYIHNSFNLANRMWH